MVVSDWAPPWSKRWTRKAEFLERRWSIESDAFQPIFDVSLAKVDETGLYLVGHEMGKDESTGQPMEHVQVWWCQPIQPAGVETGLCGEPADKKVGAPVGPCGAPVDDPARRTDSGLTPG